MQTSWLKWTQLVVSIAATILAGLVWPGVMVVIAVAIGAFYVVSAAGAAYDLRPLVWSAFLLSIGVAVLSTTTVVIDDFAALRIESEMGDPPMVAVSPTRGTIVLDSIPETTLADMRRNYATVVKRQKFMVAVLLLVSIGSCAVVLMHGYAWKWLIYGKGAGTR